MHTRQKAQCVFLEMILNPNTQVDDIFEFYEEHQRDINLFERDLDTRENVFHILARTNDHSIADGLLKEDADMARDALAVKNRHGDTPIDVAARHKHVEVLDVFRNYIQREPSPPRK